MHVLWYNYERDHIVHNVIQVCISSKLGSLTTALELGFSGFNSSVGFLHVPDVDSDEGMVIPKLGQLMSVFGGVSEYIHLEERQTDQSERQLPLRRTAMQSHCTGWSC